jgi:hypothetical protein
MQLRVPDTIAPGSQVKCPKCAATFAANNAPVSAPPPAPGQFSATPPIARAENPAQSFPSRPLRSELDYQDAAHRPRGQGFGLDGITPDYTFDFAGYFRSGMAHYSAVFGPMLGYGFILFAISMLAVVPYIGSCFQLIIYGFVFFAMYGGFVIVALKQMRGREWNFGDLFGGWAYWVPLFVVNLLKIVVGVVCGLPAIAAYIIWIVVLLSPGSPSAAAGQPAPPPRPDFTWIAVAGLLYPIGMLGCLAVNVRLFLFTPWFVIDRNCGPMEAIKGNWELTRGHFWGWFGTALLLWLIYLLSWAPCCLGIPFFLPLYYLVLNAAWMQITQPQVMEGPL